MFAPTRLQARFALVVAIWALLFSALVGAVAYYFSYHRATDESRKTIEQLCQTVNKTAAIAAYVGNQDVASDVVEGLLSQQIVLAASVSGGEQMKVERGKPGGGEPSDWQVHCPLFSPFDNTERVGELLITPSGTAITQNARAAAAVQVAMLVALVAAISMMLMVMVGVLFSGPIGRLAAALRQLTPGTSERLTVPERHLKDEIGLLVNSSNQLLEATESAFAQERKLRAEVEAMEQQYRSIFDSTSAGILVLDGEGRMINANPTLMRIIGRSAADYGALSGVSFFNDVFVEPAQAWALVHSALHQQQTVADDLALRRPDGSTAWVHCLISAHTEQGRVSLVEGVLYDITERKHKESEVMRQAEHDVLTGLKNRRSSEDFLDRALAQAASHGECVALMLIDLDGFKPVNDRYGHAAGDEVLVAVANRLGACIRQSMDLAGRLGGDEFVIVMRDCGQDPASAARVADSVVRSIAQPVELSTGEQVLLGASVGIARFPQDGRAVASLMKAADDAMYDVKRHGKNGYGFASRA